MSSFIKNKLKAARDAIGKKEYKTAQDASIQVLEYEPNNYNALVFLGLTCLELGEHAKSEEAYKKATELNPDQLLAWQGLSRFYERTERWKEYGEMLRHLINLFVKQEDTTKCAETLQRFIDLQQSRGTRESIIDALSLLLPSSPLYPTLSMLPEPEPTAPTSTNTYAIQVAVHNSLPTLEEIVALSETEEDEKIQKEIEKRRMRLGAGKPEQIKKDVSREVWETSKLSSLYDEILNHPNTTDENRRATERKLLRRKMHHLETLSTTVEGAKKKSNLLSEVETLCNGVVLLGLPDELAWMFVIGQKDAFGIEEYDFRILRQFIKIFPNSPRTKLIQGYFQYTKIPLALEYAEEDEKQADEDTLDDTEDGFTDVLNAASLLPESILSYRMTSKLYRIEEDYESTIKAAETGLELVRRTETNYGKSLPRVKRAFRVDLAISLVKLYPPKHHERASKLISSILSEDPENVSCLMAHGCVLQYANDWLQAQSVFKQVIDLQPDHPEALDAQEEWAWSMAKSGNLEGGIKELRSFLKILDDEPGREEQKARAWWRLGKALWDSEDKNRETAYKLFITSLKHSSSFAPAFTSLGIYYAEVASPPDLDRSSKCFQKAFELDAREGEAARRLAEGFAEEQEWDLVEVVGRRTIEGEGGLEGGIVGNDDSMATRYLPTNAWAWKAVGVVELHRRNYSAAIQSFQVALRAHEDDYVLWQRLGEAYSRAGRHAAAIKALKRAIELQPVDWMAQYLLGDVYRLMGQYSSAIEVFEGIRATHPDEISVLTIMAETHLSQARMETAEGFKSRAEASAVATIRVSSELLAKSSGFRRMIWKFAADAAYELSRFMIFDDKESVLQALSTLVGLMDGQYTSSFVKGIINFPISAGKDDVNGEFALEVSILAYDFRTSLDKLDDAAGADTLFDLGVALAAFSNHTLDKPRSVLANTQAKALVQKALTINPSNDVYWHILANLNFIDNPKLSQHLYLKALDCDSKNAATWTNLGFLYLYHGDNELANEALYRAQVLDPEYILAWVGQGLVASSNGHQTDSLTLFSHAVSISADIPAADLEFSKRAFESLEHPKNSQLSLEELLPIFHSLDRYCRCRPTDASALHLFALVCERANQTDQAIKLVSDSISLLERSYEETEDPATEEHFAFANGTLGRLLLAIGDFEKAVTAFSTSLSLLPSNAEDPRVKTMRTLAQFGSGIAHFRQEELEEALGFFETCLSEIPTDMSVIRGHVTMLLSQTLWALGSPEAQETARSQLLECISNDPDNLNAMSALVAIGILDSDDQLVDAALSEIQSLSPDKRNKMDPGHTSTKLLIHNHVSQGREKEALSEAQKAVHMDPLNEESRKVFATLLLQEQKMVAASAILQGNESVPGEDLGATLKLLAIATRDDAASALKLSQRAIFISPWEKDNWTTLAYIRCRNSKR